MPIRHRRLFIKKFTVGIHAGISRGGVENGWIWELTNEEVQEVDAAAEPLTVPNTDAAANRDDVVDRSRRPLYRSTRRLSVDVGSPSRPGAGAVSMAAVAVPFPKSFVVTPSGLSLPLVRLFERSDW